MTAPRAHFLHVGKTGGTAIKAALAPATSSGRYRILLHEHATRLADVPAGEKFFFTVRDPVDRFVSGFYSRQRCGRPRYNYPWSAGEAAAFAAFTTAGALAEALGSADVVVRGTAEAAMASIQHVRDSYWRWFTDDEYFLRRSGDLLFLAFHDQFSQDFAVLTRMLGLTGRVALPTDDVGAHRTPATVDRRLSATAVRNLRAWYAADYRFLELARAVWSGRLRGAGG